MSILIKGMKMPKHCWQCPFHDDMDDCILLNQSCMKVWGETKHLDDCPLIELPPHGDLIDRDALTNNILLRTYIRFHTGETPPSEWMILGQHIINAPTILEAEREE